MNYVWKGIELNIARISLEPSVLPRKSGEPVYRQNRASGNRSIDSLGVAGYYVKNSCSSDSFSPREGSDPQRTPLSRSYFHPAFLFLSFIFQPSTILIYLFPCSFQSFQVSPFSPLLFSSFDFFNLFLQDIAIQYPFYLSYSPFYRYSLSHF